MTRSTNATQSGDSGRASTSSIGPAKNLADDLDALVVHLGPAPAFTPGASARVSIRARLLRTKRERVTGCRWRARFWGAER
jgi:hypothetical protein